MGEENCVLKLSELYNLFKIIVINYKKNDSKIWIGFNNNLLM